MEHDAFLREIESFLLQNEMTAAAFGKQAANDSALVLRLRKGRSAGRDLMRRVLLFMENYRASIEA